MTTETTITETKEIPAFYIFEKRDGRNLRVGAAFRHRKGEGLTILVGDRRFAAFVPQPEIK